MTGAVELLEREIEQGALERALGDARAAGRVAVVLGEAGIGKSALLHAVMEGAGLRVLWGVCDPLVTPRALGPFVDVAAQAGGTLQEAVATGGREHVLAALLEELAAGPSALVLEDLHWADDATLDLTVLLARRVGMLRGCLVVSCRPDAVARRPEVRRALEAFQHARLARVELRPLTAAAVATLAAAAGRAPGDLHRITGGNPFYVSEVLAAPAGAAPGSGVRAAVMTRARALPASARAVLELVSVVPGRAELWLLDATIGPARETIDACLTAGLLELHGDAVAFRHEIARRAVEAELAPLQRVELERLVLAALEARGGVEPARLAHHARRAGDAAAIRRLAPAAARAAAAAGAHRQALDQWEAALAASDGRDVTALEGVSEEAYLCGRPERALEARRAALAVHEAAGDTRAVGECLRWISRLLWWAGRGPEAAETGERAIAVLGGLAPGRELAMALSGQSQLAMLAERTPEALARGEEAMALARRLGATDVHAHALINVGTTRLGTADHERGRAELEAAFALAAERDHDHAARALVNLATSTLLRRREDERVHADLARALAYAEEHGLDGYVQYLLGARANVQLMRGRWAEAEGDARTALAMGEHAGVSLCPALVALGRLQSRRDDDEAEATLADAWQRAMKTGEPQRLAPAAAARAELAWLRDDLPSVAAAAREGVHHVASTDLWTAGELVLWLRRAGAAEPGLPVAAPYARSLAGDWSGAAAAWEALGFPYEAADALTDAPAAEEDAPVRALTALDALGARAAAARLRRRLRAAGLRRIPRGPRSATRAAPAGLTARQLDVLRLLATGATNREIAERLVISPKTVDHHVSAVLAKLGAETRRDAAAAARRLGVGADDDGAAASPAGPAALA